MICVDTVTLTYLLLEHPTHSPAVRGILDQDSAWCAPPLWRSELRSTLMQYVRSQDASIPGSTLTLNEAVQRMAAAEALIQTFPVDSETVLRRAFDLELTPYDSEYVVLAERLDVPLLTYDRAVLRALPKKALRPQDFDAS
ncbi:MAG: type II toxin-antitoxin system VapC family toxin [Bacteroidota bacterium]